MVGRKVLMSSKIFCPKQPPKNTSLGQLTGLLAGWMDCLRHTRNSTHLDVALVEPNAASSAKDGLLNNALKLFSNRNTASTLAKSHSRLGLEGATTTTSVSMTHHVRKRKVRDVDILLSHGDTSGPCGNQVSHNVGVGQHRSCSPKSKRDTHAVTQQK